MTLSGVIAPVQARWQKTEITAMVTIVFTLIKFARFLRKSMLNSSLLVVDINVEVVNLSHKGISVSVAIQFIVVQIMPLVNQSALLD